MSGSHDQKKTVLVTGANRGIGFAVVQALAQRSSNLSLVVASRNMANARIAIEQLQGLGLEADFCPLELDIASDESIRLAVQKIQDEFGRLDVLVNNAGIASSPLQNNDADFRSTYNQILNTNVTSVGLITTLFLPLLHRSSNSRVINISSGRGSMGLVTSGANPRTSNIPYSLSKVALNLLTVEMSHAHPEIEFQVVNPGWCKTAFNGFRGPKDPLEGALSTVELALAEKGVYKAGFWAYEKNGMEEVPW